MGGSEVSLCSEGFERGVDWAELTGRPAPPAAGPAGIRTADLQVNGRVHYHFVLPAVALLLLVAESATEKTQTVCFCLPACLPG